MQCRTVVLEASLFLAFVFVLELAVVTFVVEVEKTVAELVVVEVVSP